MYELIENAVRNVSECRIGLINEQSAVNQMILLKGGC